MQPDAKSLVGGVETLKAAEALFRRYLLKNPTDIDARLDLWRAQVISGRAYSYLGRPDLGRAIVETNLSNAAVPVKTPMQRSERNFILDGSYLILGESYADSQPQRALYFDDQLISHVSLQSTGASNGQEDFLHASGYGDRAE